MCMERRRFSQTIASEWQKVFVVSHKMPWCALFTADKNYNKSLEKLQDFFFKTETKTKCSRPRPRLHDSRPRLSFLSSRHLETKTMVSRTTSLLCCPFSALTLLVGWQEGHSSYGNLVTAISKVLLWGSDPTPSGLSWKNWPVEERRWQCYYFYCVLVVRRRSVEKIRHFAADDRSVCTVCWCVWSESAAVYS